MRRRLLAALLAALPTVAAAQSQSAREFLQGLYDPYLQKGFKGQPYTDVDRFFAPDLARAIRHDMDLARSRGEAPLLNGDPFVDAQEWEISALSIASSVSGDTAAAGVSFVNLGRARALVVMLVLTPRGWRISDVIGAGGSLRELFKLP